MNKIKKDTKSSQECTLLGLLLTGIQFALYRSIVLRQYQKSAFDRQGRTASRLACVLIVR